MDIKEKIAIVHLQIVKDGEVEYEYHLDSPKNAADFAGRLIRGRDREQVLVCCLDASKKPVSVEIAGVGSCNSCMFSPPEIFKCALLCNAAGVMVFHSHTSGETEPSREDIRATEKLKKAGFLIGIPVIDHIIVGEEGRYYSFFENGYI